MMNNRIEIGVIADTHGLLWLKAVEYLKDCHYMLHAGDIGKEEVPAQLKAIAPTFAVHWMLNWIPTIDLLWLCS